MNIARKIAKMCLPPIQEKWRYKRPTITSINQVPSGRSALEILTLP
jgi:hypothetical protein